jgi:hypothetical protein
VSLPLIKYTYWVSVIRKSVYHKSPQVPTISHFSLNFVKVKRLTLWIRHLD